MIRATVMALFKIRGADQNEYGPVTADVVIQWIAANRLARHSLAQIEGSTEWKPLSEFPEFQGVLSAQSAPPPPMLGGSYPSGGSQQGMAIASLVLGIGGITCLSLFAGIPAIILGHMAHSRARKMPAVYGGAGMALAGLILGYLSVVLLPVSAALLLPALAKAKERAQTITCVNQMKAVGFQIQQYASEHNEAYPPNLLVLSNKLTDPKGLICPSDSARRRRNTWNDVAISGSSYLYYSMPRDVTATNQQEILRCPIHGNVAHSDGSVTQGSRSRRPAAPRGN